MCDVNNFLLVSTAKQLFYRVRFFNVPDWRLYWGQIFVEMIVQDAIILRSFFLNIARSLKHSSTEEVSLYCFFFSFISVICNLNIWGRAWSEKWKIRRDCLINEPLDEAKIHWQSLCSHVSDFWLNHVTLSSFIHTSCHFLRWLQASQIEKINWQELFVFTQLDLDENTFLHPKTQLTALQISFKETHSSNVKNIHVDEYLRNEESFQVKSLFFDKQMCDTILIKCDALKVLWRHTNNIIMISIELWE